jgi:hypothetical protein
MSDTFREVTTRSWFSRVGGSIGGMFFGLLLLLVGIVLLFWNEGRAVQTAKSLAEGAGIVVSVTSAAVDPANEGRLVHTSGTVATDETLADTAFGISHTGVRLVRSVEMYQWKETSKSETKTKLGGGEETVTTYSYSREWSSSAIDSSSFRQPDGHRNPAMTIEGQTFQIDGGTLGAYKLDAGVLDRIGGEKAAPVGNDMLNAVRAAANVSRPVHIADGRIHVGFEPSRPSVGDYRISYQLAPLSEISVVARQTGAGFSPYQTEAGDRLLMVETGGVPADQMFAHAVTGNTILTWVLRIVGLLLLVFAFGLLLAPLGVVGDVIPPFGRLVRMGTGIVGFVCAALVGSVTIAIAWFWYRPLLSLVVIAIGVGVAALVIWLGRNRSTDASAAEPQT